MRWKMVGENEGDFRRKLDTGVQELTRQRRWSKSTNNTGCVVAVASLNMINKIKLVQKQMHSW